MKFLAEWRYHSPRGACGHEHETWVMSRKPVVSSSSSGLGLRVTLKGRGCRAAAYLRENICHAYFRFKRHNNTSNYVYSFTALFFFFCIFFLGSRSLAPGTKTIMASSKEQWMLQTVVRRATKKRRVKVAFTILKQSCTSIDTLVSFDDQLNHSVKRRLYDVYVYIVLTCCSSAVLFHASYYDYTAPTCSCETVSHCSKLVQTNRGYVTTTFNLYFQVGCSESPRREPHCSWRTTRRTFAVVHLCLNS